MRIGRFRNRRYRIGCDGNLRTKSHSASVCISIRALTGGIGLGLNSMTKNVLPESETDNAFSSYQKRRRDALWGLLGDLPWQHESTQPKVVRTEEHDLYTLQRLVLDVNGIEPVPALLLIPKRLQRPAPGLLFIHWHAGMYDLGKEQLLRGTNVQPAYAPVLAEMGVVTLAIDSWCFGERQHDRDGHRGEEDTFKLMLWRGQVLWGMMIFDEFRALSYLAGRAARRWTLRGWACQACPWDRPRRGGWRRWIPGSG